ncbi:DUF1003 domain-containing protein, partial [Candidatus Amesbacteria bacterium]|nr:DUF1003 domain-containing protein [Candidatus Amesbacteria bacterium]
MPQSLEAKLHKNRKFTERLADNINRTAGNFLFFLLHLSFFAFWVLFMGKLDPFPFTFLTLLVSLEAIFLSIFVLMSQNRQSTIDSLREEIHLQINEIAEREITKALSLLRDIHRHTVKDPKPDPELDHMLQNIDTGKIERSLEKELEPPPLVIS